MESKRVYLGLDVGAQRIGLAFGDSIARLAQPSHTLVVDGQEETTLRHLVHELGVTDFVVGRPRDQAGLTTGQTQAVETFVASTLQPFNLPTHWQDESLTSVIAEERLAGRKKPYSKADIDAEAATIILQDYLDSL